MATYAQITTGPFVEWVKWVNDERRCIQNVTLGSNSVDNAQANINAITTPDFTPNTKRQLEAALDTRRRSQLGALRASGRAAFLPIAVEIAKVIDSPNVDGDVIQSLTGFFEDWRDFQTDVADERVAVRAITFGPEPAASTAGIYFRLTVEHREGDPIESGRHNQTKTISILRKSGAFQATVEIEGTDGPVDLLDYQAGSAKQAGFGGTLETDMVSRGNPDLGGLVTNAMLIGNSDTADNAVVTVITGWTLTKTASPAVLIDRTNVFQLGNSTSSFSISLSGNDGEFKIVQNVPAQALADRLAPLLPVVALRLTASWTGTITVTWGGVSQVFTQADLTLNDWVLIAPDRDLDLYPFNFDTASPQYTLNIVNGAAIGADELIIGAFFIVQMVRHQGVWYAVLMDDVEPDLQDSVTFVDANSAAGPIQDTLGFTFDDELSGVGFLKTTGANLLAALA